MSSDSRDRDPADRCIRIVNGELYAMAQNPFVAEARIFKVINNRMFEVSCQNFWMEMGHRRISRSRHFNGSTYVGTSDSGIWKSGAEWSQMGQELGQMKVRQLFIHNNMLYASMTKIVDGNDQEHGLYMLDGDKWNLVDGGDEAAAQE